LLNRHGQRIYSKDPSFAKERGRGGKRWNLQVKKREGKTELTNSRKEEISLNNNKRGGIHLARISGDMKGEKVRYVMKEKKDSLILDTGLLKKGFPFRVRRKNGEKNTILQEKNTSTGESL